MEMTTNYMKIKTLTNQRQTLNSHGGKIRDKVV